MSEKLTFENNSRSGVPVTPIYHVSVPCVCRNVSFKVHLWELCGDCMVEQNKPVFESRPPV